MNEKKWMMHVFSVCCALLRKMEGLRMLKTNIEHLDPPRLIHVRDSSDNNKIDRQKLIEPTVDKKFQNSSAYIMILLLSDESRT